MTTSPLFFIAFSRRDFSGPVVPLVSVSPVRLSWSAFGGPDSASLSASGSLSNLLDLASLLRCGVMVRDHQNTPVWWGFVDEVTLFLEDLQLKVSLENLFNQVKVQYSFISPDNKLADQLETSVASNPQSQREFGIKETVIHRSDLDENFASALRDTFLSLHTWPTSELSQRSKPGDVCAELHCSGWFKTLSWQNYENPEGFYANYGPGPGVFAFGDLNAHRFVAQSFTPSADVALTTVYFKLRTQGSPTSNLSVHLYNQSANVPGSLLSSSSAVSPSTLNATNYTWVRFSFPAAYALSAGQTYWIVVDPGGVDPANYCFIKTDENMSFSQVWRIARTYDQTTSTWGLLPSVTAPGSRPHLVFRFVCISDSGSQLAAIASAGNQFFQKITCPSTGVKISPNRMNGNDCLKEIEALMKLGTSNQRMVLASVTPGRHLTFYEQPDPDTSDIFLDSKSRFFTKQQVLLPSYLPPVGRFARLSATTRVSLPWDRNRIPACFIMSADYRTGTGNVIIKAM